MNSLRTVPRQDTCRNRRNLKRRTQQCTISSRRHAMRHRDAERGRGRLSAHKELKYQTKRAPRPTQRVARRDWHYPIAAHQGQGMRATAERSREPLRPWRPVQSAGLGNAGRQLRPNLGRRAHQFGASKASPRLYAAEGTPLMAKGRQVSALNQAQAHIQAECSAVHHQEPAPRGCRL